MIYFYFIFCCISQVVLRYNTYLMYIWRKKRLQITKKKQNKTVKQVQINSECSDIIIIISKNRLNWFIILFQINRIRNIIYIFKINNYYYTIACMIGIMYNIGEKLGWRIFNNCHPSLFCIIFPYIKGLIIANFRFQASINNVDTMLTHLFQRLKKRLTLVACLMMETSITCNSMTWLLPQS